MNQWHESDEIEGAFIRLLDALCNWERSTGRDSLLVFVPVEGDERVIVAIGGKPHDISHDSQESITDVVQSALRSHGDPDRHSFVG